MMQLRYTSAPLRGAKISSAMLRHLGKPVLTVLRWQLAATGALALAAALVAGRHGAVSALAGGFVSITAGLAAALVASMGNAKSAGGIVLSALRAEAVKLGLAVLLLWIVLVNYSQAVVGALIAAFVVTLRIFAMAFFVRDYSWPDKWLPAPSSPPPNTSNTISASSRSRLARAVSGRST